MTNKFYAADERRGALVQALFDTIATRYDLINDLQSFGLHRRWKKRLLELAAGNAGARALDLCCGTGDISFAFARAGLDVTGLDFSAEMLSVAAQRLRTQCLENGAQMNVQFLRGDALNIPFPDESFDIVSIGYGLRNLADFERGLREMHRVLRPGGRLLVLDFGKPDNSLWCGIYFGFLKFCVPVLGKLFCGEADTHGYILESLKHYAAQRGVDGKLRELDFARTRIVNLLGGAMSINYAEKHL